MAGENQLDVSAFAAAYQEMAQAVTRAAPHKEGPFATLLREHLQADTTELPVVAMEVDGFDHANLQRAIDALASHDDVAVERLAGIQGEQRLHGNLSLSTLTQSSVRVEVGPVDHVERYIDTDRTLTCIDFGLLLLRVNGSPAAVLVRSADERFGRTGITVEVMAVNRDAGADLLNRVRTLMAEHNVFRQQVISLSVAGPFGHSLEARFVPRPTLAADDVILPEGVLERVERMTVEFSARAASLRAGGRHLRRGLLLHGPPGTGKTHTVRYLMSRLADRTVFILSGQGLAAIGKTVALARQLQPAIVVLEDVDLVAEERTRPHAGANPVLFELLNQMDGVEEDADIVFILTTNRADLLEPALASRPGRIDLAVEIPLPAAAERHRLLELYSPGLRVDTIQWDPVVERTDGCSAAFLRELLRQAALEGATTDGEPPRLDENSLISVLANLNNASQAITLRLLGST